MEANLGSKPGGIARANGKRRGTDQPSRRARYLERIEDFAARIRRAEGLPQILELLNEAVRETRQLQGEAPAGKVRSQVAAAEREIASLRSELELTDALLREDRVTGTLNARGLAAAYEREASRATRQDSALSLLLIDLDRYPGIGAAAGHQVLMHFAGLAGRLLRSSDCLGRRANAEFAAVLPEARLADARQCALRLQAALAQEPATLLGQPVRLTFSAGVVQRRHGEAMDELLGRAREALQGAQRTGMNRIKAGE